jgi:hypothetical protein
MGNCWDNICAKTLFGSLKGERLHGQRIETLREAKTGVPADRSLSEGWQGETIEWLLWYNRTRMHSTRNYFSPMQFEQEWAEARKTIVARKAGGDRVRPFHPTVRSSHVGDPGRGNGGLWKARKTMVLFSALLTNLGN